MKRIVFTMMMLALLLYAGESQYAEKWSGRSKLEINYGHILGDEPFPYHPTQKEYYKALLKGAASSLDVQVVTEDGIPIKDAIVRGGFKGPEFKENDIVGFNKRTDSQGNVHLEGNCGGEIFFYATKEGWYDSCGMDLVFISPYGRALQDGKWHPYGMKHELVLRPIRKQVRMYGPDVNFSKRIPRNGEPIGLDLFACDWVAPYGKGETADLFLQHDIKENEEEKLETLTFSFPNPGDGIYRRHSFRRSTYMEDYNASEDSSKYEKKMVFYRKSKYSLITSGWGVGEKEENLVSQNDIGDDDFLVLRTRTRQDENGNVISCHYTKIINQICFAKNSFMLSWLTNPTANDTNLEHDTHSRYALYEAREEAQHKAELEQTQRDLASLANRFLGALENGKLDDFKACFLIRTMPQNEHVCKWFSQMSPKFTSGEIEAKIEPKFFFSEGRVRIFAIVPVRIWQKGHPEKYEIKPLFLVHEIYHPWSVMINFENINDRLNSLDGKMPLGYDDLYPRFEEYARTQVQQASAAETVRKDEDPAIQKADSVKQADDEKDSFVATGERAAAVTAAVKHFLLVLKDGQKDKAVSAYGSVSKEQADTVDKWLAKAIPFFKSGKVESAVEPIVWISGDAAIIPIRQWRPARPDIYEIEPTCLVRREGKWRLLPELENPDSPVNALDETTARTFSRLLEKFNEFKAERKREMH
ncbi:MAG: hypothetical protein IJJ26_02945 [Victivallales bacterium]|nr:hypothetical protein [Victivallales bacterium]